MPPHALHPGPDKTFPAVLLGETARRVELLDGVLRGILVL